MIKLSEYKNEKAVELLADLLDPICKIAANPGNQKAKGKSKIHFAQAMMKNNAREIVDILAILSGENPEKYECTAADILVGVLELLNDDEISLLFGLQSQKKGVTPSGSVSESVET